MTEEKICQPTITETDEHTILKFELPGDEIISSMKLSLPINDQLTLDEYGYLLEQVPPYWRHFCYLDRKPDGTVVLEDTIKKISLYSGKD